MADEQRLRTVTGTSGGNDALLAEIQTLRCENARLRELLLKPNDEAERFRQDNIRLRARIRSLEAERPSAEAERLSREIARLRTKGRSLEAERSREIARLRERVRSLEAERTEGEPEQVGPVPAPGRPRTDNSPDVSERVIAASTADVNTSGTISASSRSGMASAAPLPQGLSANYVNRNMVFPNDKFPLIPFGMFYDVDHLAKQVVKYKQDESDDATTPRYLAFRAGAGQTHHYVRVSPATTEASFRRAAGAEKNWVEMGIDIMASKDGDTNGSARRVAKVILRKYQDAVNQAMGECGYEQINYHPGKDESNDPYRALLETEVPPPDYINYDGSSTSDKANVQWNLMYAEVLKWKDEHGHPNVPNKTKKGEFQNGLVRFVGRMRVNKDKLSETRVRLVRKVCFRSCAAKGADTN